MYTKKRFQTLLIELEEDARQLRNIYDQNVRAWDRIQSGAHDYLDYAALGFTIHGIYGILELYFLRISMCFENDLPEESWEDILVDRMGSDIPGLRPALIYESKIKNWCYRS